MNGIKYLLDTKFILGILKSNPVVLADIAARQIRTAKCGYSAITRMELLGFPPGDVRKLTVSSIVKAVAICDYHRHQRIT